MIKKGIFWFILILILVIGGASWLGYKYYILGNKTNAYITIDINPSVGLAVNVDDEVLDVVSLNNDADIITSDLDLVGLPVEEATKVIIDAAIETGYIDGLNENNTVVITSSSEDEEDRTRLEEVVIDSVNSSLNSRKVYALVAAQGVDDAIKASALEYNVSNGKMLIINRAVLLNPSLNIADLAKLSIQDIQREIKYIVQNNYKTTNMTEEQLKSQWQEQKQTKIQTAAQLAQEQRNLIWNETKTQYPTATEDEKEVIINDAIDQKKTEIKAKLNSVNEQIQQVQNETSSKSKNTYPVIKNGNKAQQEVQQRQKKK